MRARKSMLCHAAKSMRHYSFRTAKLQAEMAIAFRNRKRVFVGEHAWVLPVPASLVNLRRSQLKGRRANCVSSMEESLGSRPVQT
jgi:hypothetical protein